MLETGTGPRPWPAVLRPPRPRLAPPAGARPGGGLLDDVSTSGWSGGAGSAGVECATKGVQTGPLGPIIWAFSLATTMGCSHGPHRQSEECAVLSTRIGESLDTPKKRVFFTSWIMGRICVSFVDHKTVYLNSSNSQYQTYHLLDWFP